MGPLSVEEMDYTPRKQRMPCAPNGVDKL